MFLLTLLPSDNEKLRCVSNPIPHPKYLYLSKTVVFLVNLIAANK